MNKKAPAGAFLLRAIKTLLLDNKEKIKKENIMNQFLSKVLFIVGLTLLSVMQSSFAANVGEKFGDWLYECKATGSNQTVCVISQTLISKKANKQVLRAMVSKNKKANKYTLALIAPLNISLPHGVSAVTNKGNKLKLILQSCGYKGCLAAKTLEAKELASLKAGDQLKISFVLNRKKISIDLSLKGISTGLKEL